MRNKVIKISFIFIFILLIVIAFVLSWHDTKKYNDDKERVEEIVLDYLENKYNEKFVVKDYFVEKNAFDHEVENDYITTVMNSSYIYTLAIESSRLMKFDVLYVEYKDKSEYEKNKEYDILNEGIYENYIYDYKVKDIRKEIKDKLNKYFDNINDFKVSIDGLTIDNTNFIYSRSLDTNEELDAYNIYSNMDKNVSNKEFYDNCLKINKGAKFYLEIDIEDVIEKDNITSYNKKLIKLVNYLYDLGYKEYDINFTFNNYTSARATPYLDDGKEKIYFIFDYESYANIDNDDKLGLYVLDK